MSVATALDQFFKETQARAYRVAFASVRDRDVALDVVQDAMIKLAQNYVQKPQQEWPPLFYRILQNCIKDWQRKQMVRNKVMVWGRGSSSEDDYWNPVDSAVDEHLAGPMDSLKTQATMRQLDDAVKKLSARQRQVFLLRAIEELSVDDTAVALKITAGSVKTHYFRALANLRQQLGDHWP